MDASALKRKVEDSPPSLAYKIVLWLVLFLERLIDFLVPAPKRILMRSLGFIDTQVIYTCAELQITENVGSEVLALPQLAKSLGVPEENLSRLLHAAAQIGVFSVTQRDSKIYVANNKLSWALHCDQSAGIKPLIRHNTEEVAPAMLQLLHSVRTVQDPSSKSAFELISPTLGSLGKSQRASSPEGPHEKNEQNGPKEKGMIQRGNHELDFWSYLDSKPEKLANFSQAMRVLDTLGTTVVCEDFKWGQFERVFDLGGATGSFVQAIQKRHPSITGVVCDLPKVVENAKEKYAAQQLASSTNSASALLPKISFVPIDLLKDESGIPDAMDKDCYMLRCILHDWDDAHSRTILRNIRKAMGLSKAKLAVVELIPNGPERSLLNLSARQSDLMMMVMTKGKEREKSEWKVLLAECGFELERIKRTRSPLSVLIAQPKAF